MGRTPALVRRRPRPEPEAVESPGPGKEALKQRIAERAYGIYLERGQHHGHDLDDWLEAERLILSEIGE
ncbi:MAG: DUF2934 domain-containing protein [Nitrospirota bacterium]